MQYYIQDFIFRAMNQLRCSFVGKIKVDKRDAFGLFVMDTKDVRAKLEQPIQNISNTVLQKAGGKIIMCHFDSYQGIQNLYE